MTPAVFRSRVDIWLIAVTVLALGFPLWHGLALVAAGRNDGWLLLVTAVAMVGLLRLVVLPCRYTLLDDHLLVESGITRWRVPYAEIGTVVPSRSLWAAPALSLRRVRIDWTGGALLVSPAERERFMTCLRARVSRAIDQASGPAVTPPTT